MFYYVKQTLRGRKTFACPSLLVAWGGFLYEHVNLYSKFGCPA